MGGERDLEKQDGDLGKEMGGGGVGVTQNVADRGPDREQG